MNRYTALKNKLAHCEKVQGTTMTMLSDPLLMEKMNHPDMDFILLDMEHGRFDAQNVIPMLHTLRLLGMPGILRVQDSEYHLIAKAIDMGADGVMIPRVETVDQLRTAVDGLCFAPIGRKGVGGYAQFRAGESFDEFQNGRILMIQIESPVGVSNLPEMLRLYGERISAVIIGPNDLSVMLGTPLNTGSEPMQAAIRKVFSICQSHGMSCGIFCGDASDARRYREMGANVLWTASDLQFYMRGYLETIDELRSIP